MTAACRTLGVLALSPVYGWLLDNRSAYAPVLLSAFCCSFGCLFRGLVPVNSTFALYGSHVVLGLGAVNFWNVVGAYTALSTPRDMRPVVVSGFQVQVSTLNLLGTASFPACDWVLRAAGMEDQLLRYRAHMSVCSVFCVFGFFYMLVRFRPVACSDKVDQAREEQKLDASVDKLQLLVLLGSLVIQAFGETVVTVLWPLHIKKLGWGSHEYAWLDVASKTMIISGNLAYPALARSLGYRWTAMLLPVVACMTSAAAFLQPDASLYGQTMHVFNALAFLSACGVMKVCFQHLATLAVPPSQQGRVFSLLQMLASVGGIAGNLFGTRLVDHETSFAGRGATPFLIASSLFMLAGCAVAGLLVVPQQCMDSVFPSAPTGEDRDDCMGGACVVGAPKDPDEPIGK
mmetsp:Transcript_37649/g.120005  ORF Transcript_37649/g.120005 Transcript_37649/m.120005 type:complete len:402 (-) Transcript_37649:124-1329(-)